MNFQPSVIVWTIICFLLLTVILRKLLFEPVLKVLDQRKEKIEKAKSKKAEIERLTAEHEEYIKEQQQQDSKNREAMAKQIASDIQSEGKKQIEIAQRQCLEEIQNYRESMVDERRRIVDGVAPEMETAAAIFAKNIITHRI